MSEKPEAYYGLPQDVKFCKRCVISNQRPASRSEFKHDKTSKTVAIHFDEEGICDACRYHEKKAQTIDWSQREAELKDLCDRYRRTDGDDGGMDILVEKATEYAENKATELEVFAGSEGMEINV